MKKTITKVVRCALVSLFSFLFISSAQADDLKMALFNYCNTGYEVTGWHSCQQEGGGSLNSETDNGVSVGGANIGGNFKRSFSKLVSTDLPAFATSDMQTNLGIEVPYNVYISGVANGAKTDGTITISGLDADSSYVIYAGCGHDNGNIGKSSCGFKVPSNGCTEVGSLDYVVTVASSWGRSGTSTVVADSFTSFSFNESICAGADGLALIRVKGIVPKDNGTIDLFLTGERAGINFLAIKELPPEVFPETTITAETVKVSDINAATDFSGCTADDTVIVNLVDTKTIEFDTAFSFGKAKIKLDGDLLLDSATEPTDIAKFDFKGVTGQIAYKWLIKDLPVGTGMAINFKQDSGKLGDSDEAGIPGLTIYGNVWNNTDGGSGSLAAAKMFAPDGETVIEDTMSVSWTGSLYQWTNATTGFLKGYLDDSGITFSTIVPFDRYDVYIICATDTGNAQFSYKKINGVNYSANANGEAIANSTAAWGASQQLTPILGKNVMHLEGLTAQNFAITESPKGNGRGCIAAIVIVKTAPPAAAVTATISADTDWSAIQWSGTPADNTPLELTITDSATVKLDTDVVAKNIKLIGNNTAAQVIGIEGTADKINAFLGKVTATTDFAGKFNYRYDATNGLTADSALLDTIKSAGDDKIFTFLGSGSNGATMDFNWNGTFNTHLVFDGGKHTFKRTNGGATQTFGANGTAENPTILVKDGTTLDLYGHDFCGWNAAVDVNGIIRVNSGATLNLRDYSSGTFFFSARLYLDVGSNTYVYNAANALRFNGGNVAGKEQIYVPASEDGVATITIEPNSYMYIGQENNPNAGFFIGEGSTLKIVGDLKAVNAQRELGKRGAGTLEITGNVEPIVKVDAGSLGLGGTVNSIVLNAATTIDVAEGKTATINAFTGSSNNITKTGKGKLVIKGSLAGYTGTITVTDGMYDIGSVRDFSTIGNITTSGTGTLSATAIVADDGEVKIVNVPTGTGIVVYDIDGTTKLQTTVVGTTVTAKSTIKTSGEACLYDWTFTNTVVSVGRNKNGLNWDTGYNADNGFLSGDDFIYKAALKTQATPYSNFTINYPTEWTCVVAGIVPNTANAALIAFGTRNDGSIAILKGATDTEVIIARTTGDSAYKALATMQVANALTTSHTYAFVKTADAITVYLDGNLWNTTPVSNVSFGNRIQVGSIHGGKGSTGIESSKDATNATAIQAVRIFEGALGPNALKQLANEFPYNSPNGTFAREFAEGEDTWTLTDSWTNTKTQEKAELPAVGSTLNISAAGETSITVDLAEETTYEAMTISGAAMTFKQDGALAVNLGLTTISAPVEIEYGSISIASGPIVISGEGSVTFDYANAPTIDFEKIGFVALTGTTDALADGKVTCTALPTAPAGRSISFGYSAEHKAYGVTTVADRSATTLYLTESTTLDDDTLFATTPDGEADMPRLFEDDEIVVPSGITLTIPTAALTIPLTTPIEGEGTIAVTGTTLTEAAPLFTVAEDWAGAVEITNTTMNGSDLNTYGNENSTVKLTGVVGYLKNGVEFKPEVILANNNLAGLELTNGSSNTTVIFSKVSGTGNFIGNNDSVTQRIAIIDASEHTGQVRMETKMGITLGSAENAAGDAAIAVADGATIKFGNQQWLATNGVTFGETLTVVGAVGSYITMPEPTEIPAITLLDAQGQAVEGNYMLKYDDGKLVVDYATVAVAIPEIAGADVVVTVEGVEDPIEVIDGFAAIPYGAHLYVTYTVKEGKLFKSGASAIELEYESVTVDPEIANDITEDDVTVDAGARIGDVYYLDIPAALSNAEGDQTVVVLQDAELVSLTVPEGVTLDLNGKSVSVGQGNITNNGTIIVYDEKTVLALIDTHGMIKFANDLMVASAYFFPAGTTIQVTKVPGVDGATISNITLPDDGIAYNYYGAAAKKAINVFPGEGTSGLVLAGIIERGSQNTDTIINVGGACMIVGPLVIGEDGKGMDYEKYPDDKAILMAPMLMFYDETAVITLIPERGEVQTFTKLIDNPDVAAGSIVTVDRATIVETAVSYSEGVTLYTYTAEWIKPDATVEPMAEKPEELAAAATFTAAEAGAPKYADYTATLTITADKDVAQDAIILAGQFNATDLEDPAGINNNYDGEWIDMPLTRDLEANDPYEVIGMPWNFVAESVKTFNCGLKNIKLAEETTFTVTLTIAEGDDTVLTKDIAFTIPAAEILPTAEVTPITAEGYEAAVEFTAGEIGKGYENWTAEFVLTSDVAIGADEIKLGGSYAAWQEGAWVNIDFPGCEAGGSVSVLGLVGHDDITVQTVFETIQSFKCGVKNIGLKNDATFTLKFVITDGKTTKDICSIDNLTVKAKTIEPVDPEDPQEYDTPEKAQEAAAKMNGEGGTIKPEYINAPAGFKGDKAEYASLFKAVVDGKIVTVKLTEAAQESIKAELKNADNEATILMPDAEGKATIAAKPGLFYGIKAVNSLSNMATAEGQNWVMATGATVKVEVPDVTDADGAKAKAAFFQVTCSAKKPVE